MVNRLPELTPGFDFRAKLLDLLAAKVDAGPREARPLRECLLGGLGGVVPALERADRVAAAPRDESAAPHKGGVLVVLHALRVPGRGRRDAQDHAHRR